MVKLVNRAKMTTATTGTGTITLGSAVDGFQTFSAAGVANGDIVRYVIEDGDNWEIGTGVYSVGILVGTTLIRLPSESSNAGSAINLSGDAVVYITAAAEDFVSLGVEQEWQSFTTTGGSPQRQVNVTYTNTTGRPIMVSVAGFFSSTSLVVNNISVGFASLFNNSGFTIAASSTMTAVVPPSATYRVNGSVVPNLWAELR